MGKDALVPITATVTDGETLSLAVTVQVTATSTNYDEANGAITVDPLYLTLPPGVTFDSGVSNFLSGAAPPAVPEGSTWAMLFMGLPLGQVAPLKSPTVMAEPMPSRSSWRNAAGAALKPPP